MSVMSSSAAWAIPMATAANSEPKRAPQLPLVERMPGDLRQFGEGSGPLVGHEQVADHHVVARRPLEPAHVPDVVDLHLAGGDHAKPGARPVLDHAVDADVVGVVGAAGERPPAAEAEPALVPHRLACRVDHAGVDDVGAVGEDLVVGVLRQVRVEARPLRADRRHPGDRGVGPGQLLNHGQALIRPHLVTAVRARHVPPEDAGRPQLLREVTRHRPRLLDLLGTRADFGSSAARCRARCFAPEMLRFQSLASSSCRHAKHYSPSAKLPWPPAGVTLAVLLGGTQLPRLGRPAASSKTDWSVRQATMTRQLFDHVSALRSPSGCSYYVLTSQ